jgi:DHA2 family methylenomycin A resistance protein-like MFS transporter
MTEPAGSTATTHRLLLPTIALGIMLAPLNSTMIAVALPDIQRAFDSSVTATAWLVTIYLIAMAVGQPVGGRLGDLYGRRRVYLVGLAWFALASLGCALAPDLLWLIVFRVQQALAGTLVFPNGAALVREVVPSGRRGMAFGLIGLSASVAAASGPPVGGVLVERFGWSSIFWVNVPLLAVVLAMASASLPRRVAPARPRERFDLAGIALLTMALSAVMLLPTLLNLDRLALALAVGMVGIGVAWLFLRWEWRVAAPVVDPRLFRNAHFAAACAAILLGNLVMYTTLLAVPTYLEHVRGESASATGLVLAAMSVLAAFATPLGGRWSDRQGRWMPAVAGGLIVLAGTLATALAVYAGSVSLLVTALAVMGLGLGVSGAPVQATSVESVPAAKAGSASGIYSTSRYIGSVVGSSALAMLFAREPSTGDGERFVGLFLGLTLVAALGVLANARIADRGVAPHPSTAAAPRR